MSKAKSGKMKDDAKRELNPKLRFPEFSEDGEWVDKRLKDVAPLQRGFDLPTRKIVEGKVPIVYSNGILKFHNVGMAKGPGLVTGRSGTIGKLHFIESGDYWPHNTSLWVTSFNENVPKFIYYLYDRIGLERFSSGSGVPTLNRNDVHSFVALMPPSELEQQKIADCLSSLDELIAAHSRKLDALKAHKKGLMQQLFPREGETLPRLRFPEFKDAKPWKPKKLDKIATRGSGHTPSKSKPEYYNGGIKWVSLTDSKRLDHGLITETDKEISELGIQNSSAVLHPEGTVFVSRDAGVGKSAVMGVPMAVSQHFIAWTCDKGDLTNWFLYYLLQRSKPLFERMAVGNTIKTIGLQFFKDWRITVPLPDEQERIGECLRSVDDLIDATSQKLHSLTDHKKGLMQQLFPTVEDTK